MNIISGYIGFLIGVAITAVALEVLHRRQFGKLLSETERAIDSNMKLAKERDHLKTTAKRMTAANNRLQIRLAELTKEPEVKQIKINDKVKEEKPWCVF